MQITLTKGLNWKCCDCGIALYKEEKALELIGKCIDFIDHKTSDMREDEFIFCSGCRERIMENHSRYLGDAILKRKELEKDGHVSKKLDFSDTVNDYLQGLQDNPTGFKTPDDVWGGI